MFFSSPARCACFLTICQIRAVLISASFGEKNFAASARLHQFWSLGREICCQGFACFSPNGHQTGLVSFASHAHDTLFEIEISSRAFASSEMRSPLA
jgi:hypothetical protein